MIIPNHIINYKAAQVNQQQSLSELDISDQIINQLDAQEYLTKLPNLFDEFVKNEENRELYENLEENLNSSGFKEMLSQLIKEKNNDQLSLYFEKLIMNDFNLLEIYQTSDELEKIENFIEYFEMCFCLLFEELEDISTFSAGILSQIFLKNHTIIEIIRKVYETYGIIIPTKEVEQWIINDLTSQLNTSETKVLKLKEEIK